MHEENLDYLMIALMLIGSYVVFWKMHLENPYYNYVKYSSIQGSSI
jgi:predicted membrane channel-forming protein YqfA (hemolysin III family)